MGLSADGLASASPSGTAAATTPAAAEPDRNLRFVGSGL
jgi:hypothetical protein